ncbi:GNAT family N-acetyltransferase [Pedobacter sp. MR22-3]|uniref:GNAT family N-acetyltransferase n=1 Tax=Pedobacter sp. MR22-3 TaxID=2994552 RepID=UPI0022475CF1|nr:GNAT family N-acetyltransferase [Pedobacter sp. MR22-3]MCX2585608.1 GNAT family N-acetyltransferase [Pedobacter sp. MR22-3]
MINFRNATNADFNLAFQIKKTSIKPCIEKIWGWDDGVQLDFHTKDFNPEKTKIIMDESNEAIGLMVTTEDDTHIYLQSLLLCQNAQGKGLGTEILLELIGQARSRSKQIKLQVFKVNTRAKALYERLGFSTTGQTAFHHQMICS